MPILVIAGSDDPCIASKELFDDLLSYLTNEVGYINVSSKLYPGKRHEILNENNKEQVYSDVLSFFSMWQIPMNLPITTIDASHADDADHPNE